MARSTRDRQRKPPPEVSKSFETGVRSAGLMLPLDYMLMIIRDESADPARRDRLAVCAAQYCHPKLTDAPGKKDREAEAARQAGTGTPWNDDLDGGWAQ